MPATLASAFWMPTQRAAAFGPARIWEIANVPGEETRRAEPDRRRWRRAPTPVARVQCTACRRSSRCAPANIELLYARSVRPRARDEPVDQPAGEQRAQRIDEVGLAHQGRHGAHREAALAHQVHRQPGQHEVEGVVAREVSEARAPQRGLPQDLAPGRLVHGIGRAVRSRQLHPAPTAAATAGTAAPNTQKAERQPKCTMSRAADVRADRRTEQVAEGDDPVRPTQAPHRDYAREQLRDAGEAGALADAEQQPQQQQRREGLRETGQHGRARPEREARGEHALRAEAIRQPARRDLQQRVRPEERATAAAPIWSAERPIASWISGAARGSAPRST